MSNVIAFVNPFDAHRKKVAPMDVLVAHACGETRERLRVLLEKCGHRVTLAEDGDKALDHLGAGTTSLILSGLHLSDMGITILAKTLRLMQAGVAVRTRVVALVGDVDAGIEDLAAAGITDTLAVPIRQAELVDLLTRLSPNIAARPAAAPAPVVPVRAASFDSTVLDELAALGLGIEFEREFISQCLSDAESGLVNMDSAHKKGDWAFMREYASGIKGVAGNVGLVRLSELASTCARAQDWKLAGEGGLLMERLQAALVEGRALLLERLAVHETAAAGT